MSSYFIRRRRTLVASSLVPKSKTKQNATRLHYYGPAHDQPGFPLIPNKSANTNTLQESPHVVLRASSVTAFDLGRA